MKKQGKKKRREGAKKNEEKRIWNINLVYAAKLNSKLDKIWFSEIFNVNNNI